MANILDEVRANLGSEIKTNLLFSYMTKVYGDKEGKKRAMVVYSFIKKKGVSPKKGYWNISQIQDFDIEELGTADPEQKAAPTTVKPIQELDEGIVKVPKFGFESLAKFKKFLDDSGIQHYQDNAYTVSTDKGQYAIVGNALSLNGVEVDHLRVSQW